MNDLVISALEKRRIDADDGTHPLGGEPGGEGDRMLLGNPDVEEAVGINRLEFGQRGTRWHRRRDGHDPRIIFGELDHRLGKDVLVFGWRWRRSRRHWRRNGVPALAISCRAGEPPSFFGHHVEEYWFWHQGRLPQSFDQCAHVVPVD